MHVFQNRVLREIFEPRRDEVSGKWMILCYEEVCNLCSSHITDRTVRSRRLQQAGNVAKMGENKKCILTFDKKTQQLFQLCYYLSFPFHSHLELLVPQILMGLRYERIANL
jgi:hypothetical protein